MLTFQCVAALAAILLVVTTPSLNAQWRGDVTTPRAGRIIAVGARAARIEARAGTLRVEGRAGLTEINARGRARASSRELLDRIRLIVERRGDVAYVIVDIPEQREDWDDDDRMSLDLVVEVPRLSRSTSPTGAGTSRFVGSAHSTSPTTPAT